MVFIYLILLQVLPFIYCLDELTILNLQKNFNTSTIALGQRACGIKISFENECILNATTEDCLILPTLRSVEKRLFPKIDLTHLSGGFINKFKLRVTSYVLNSCDPTYVYYELSLSSYESYNLAENYLPVNQFKFNLQFSALSSSLENLADLYITNGEAKINISDNNATISIKSPLRKRIISYEINVNALPLEDILKNFQFNNIEDVFDKETVGDKHLALLQFTDVTAIGYSSPGKAFEFVISGKVNGPDIFGASTKVYLVLQKYVHELKDVKVLLFALLKDQSSIEIYRLLHLGDINRNLPFLNPYEGIVALAISNYDFVTVNNEELKHIVGMYAQDISDTNIINKGTTLLYRLQKDYNEDLNSTKTTNNITKFLTGEKLSNTTSTIGPDELHENIAQTEILEAQESTSFKQQQNTPIDPHNQKRNPDSAEQKQQYYYSQESPGYNNPQKQQRQILPYQPEPSGYFFVRTRREDQTGPIRSIEITTNLTTDANPDAGKFLIFEIKSTKNSATINPRQELTGTYQDIISYIMGDSEDNEKNNIPLEEDVDFRLSKVVLKKKETGVNININIAPKKSVVIIPQVFKLNHLVYVLFQTINDNNSIWSMKIGKSEVLLDNQGKVNIKHDELTNKYFLEGDLDDMYGQDQLLNKTAVSPLLEEYKHRFPELSNFPFKNASFLMELKKEGTDSTRITAKSRMFDEQETLIEDIIWTKDRLISSYKEKQRLVGITTGIFIKDGNLMDLLFKLYDKRMLKICWLEMKRIGLIFGSKRNVTIPDMFNGELNNIKLFKDDSIVIRGQLNVDLRTGCLDEPVCNFIKNNFMHELRVNVEGKIQTSSYSILSKLAGVSVPFGDQWGISQLELEISGTSEKDSGISLTGTIMFIETRYVGKFFVGEDKALQRKTFEIIFERPWRSFLGYNMINANNMIAEIDISSDEKIKEIVFDAQLEIGNTKFPLVIDDSKVIVAINRKSKVETNVAYGTLKNVSMSQIEKAFKSGKLHPLVKKMNFLDDLQVCFTNNQDGYNADGFGDYKFAPSINGKATLSTFVGNVTAQVSFKKEVLMKFQSRNLKYNDGKLLLQKSQENKREGPEFTFLLTDHNDSVVKDSMKGYMKTIGYEGPFKTELTDVRFTHHFTSYLFDEVKMSVNITGRLDQEMNETKFVTKLDESRSLKEIKMQIKKFLKSNKESVEEDIIQKMIDLQNKLLSEINAIKNDHSSLKSEIAEKQSQVFQKRLAIEKANEVIKKDCTDNCGKECVTALDWDHDCSSIRGQKLGCLKWKRCQTQASNTKCIAKCEAKKIPATITAYEQRDDIRDLAEDVSYKRRLTFDKEQLIKQGEKLFEEASTKVTDFNEKFQFLTDIDIDRKDLFSFGGNLPTSIQKLINVKPPCLRYDVINYKFLGLSYSILNKQICINGKYFKEFSKTMLEGVNKDFLKITSIKDELSSEIIKFEDILKRYNADYLKQLEKQNGGGYKDNDDEDDDDNLKDTQPNSALMNSQMNLNDTFVDSLSFKRSILPLNDNKDLLDATEADIALYLTKSYKTQAAFENDAPWNYMNKKRGLTIPALGILYLNNSTEDDSCAKRSDAIEHFEDLITSLGDIKKSYDEGMKAIDKEKIRLTNDLNEVDQEIIDARTVVSSRLERADMIFWLQKYKQGVEEYLDSASKQLEHQNKVGLKYWKTQLNSAVRTSIAQTPSGYFQKLRQNAVKSRHSFTRNKIAGQDSLDEVTKELVNIAEKEPTLSNVGMKLSKLSEKLDTFKRSALTCTP